MALRSWTRSRAGECTRWVRGGGWPPFAIWLGLICALVTGAPGGATVCYGIDGHVEIERAAAGHCVDGAVRAGDRDAPRPVSVTLEGRTSGARAGDCCGPCTDVETLSALDRGRRSDVCVASPPAGSGSPVPTFDALARRRVPGALEVKRVFALRDRMVLPLVLRC